MTTSGISDEIQKMNTTTNPTRSSGSEGAFDDDEKKRKRKESNRESARRSRKKKQEHLDGLIKQVGGYTTQNFEFRKQIAHITSLYDAMEAENKVLNAEKDRLAARLEALERTIEVTKVVKGKSSSSDLYEDCLMTKPWQLPCYSLPPITASSGGFRCFSFDD